MKTAVSVAIIGGVFTLSSVLFITWRNRGSSSLAFSTAAFAGAAVLLVLQMLFELQPEIKSDSVVTYITVDSAQRVIGHPEEVTLSPDFDWMGKYTTKQLREDRSIPLDIDHGHSKLSQDFAIYSLVWLLVDKLEWQVHKTEYVGADSKRHTVVEQISKNGTGAKVTGDYFTKKLKEADNLFAGVPLPVLGYIYLPPKSALKITPNAVVIQNPLGEIVWQLGSAPPPEPMPGATVITAKITYFGLRAKASDAQEYRNWVQRVVSDWHRWFEGTPAAGS